MGQYLCRYVVDLDFFGKKNPTKKKVKTALSFKGVTKVGLSTSPDP
jgi:hypothetical protein